MSKIGQQADIPHTVLDFLNISSKELLPYGHSLFDTRDPGLSINAFSTHWGFISQPYSLFFNNEGSSLIFNFFKDPGFNLPLDDKEHWTEKCGLESTAKAFLQHFTQGLNRNNWVNAR